jgi:hypothetical protein
MISYIFGCTKSSIYAVDGRSDCISLRVTRFEHIYEGSRQNLYTESKHKSQHVLCKASKVTLWLKAVGKNVVQPTQ